MAVEPILLDFSNDSGMDMQSDLPESDICRITVTDFNNSKVLSDQSNLQLLSRLDVEKLTDEQFDELIAKEADLVVETVREVNCDGQRQSPSKPWTKRKAESEPQGTPAKLSKTFVLPPTSCKDFLNISAMSGKQEFDTSPISSSINNTSEKCRSALNETFSLSPAASPAEKPEASDEATVVRGPIVASTPLLGLKTMSLASATPAKQQEKLSGTYTLLPDQPITPSLKPISLTSDKLNDTYDKHKTFRITSDTEVPKRPALLVPGRKSVVNKSELNAQAEKSGKAAVVPIKALPLPQRKSIQAPMRTATAAASKIPKTSGLKQPAPISSLKRPSLLEMRRSMGSTVTLPKIDPVKSIKPPATR